MTPAGKKTVFYGFTGGNDGSEPRGVLVRDKSGDLFGVAGQEGAQNFGVVFKLTPAGKLHVLHSFASGSDGDTPLAGLTTDRLGGSSYHCGTTSGLAQSGPAGTVFRVLRRNATALLGVAKGDGFVEFVIQPRESRQSGFADRVRHGAAAI